MALSNELISQFAKLVKEKPIDNGASIKGTVRVIGDKKYVQLDGSEILTPVELSVEVANDERVKVLIKDHMATVVENITSPAARNTSVEDLKDEVDEQGNTIQQMDNTIIQQGNSIIQMNTSINQHDVTINQHDTLINQQGDEIVSLNNTVVQQGNTISSMNNTIIEHGNNINSLNNTVIQQGDTINSMDNTITQHGNSIISMHNTIEQHGNQIQQQGDTIISQGNQITEIDNTVFSQGNSITTLNNTVNIQDSQIKILNSGFTIIDGVLTGLSEIAVNSLIANTLNVGYAKIDFTNIGEAAIENLFSDSGIIKDLVMQEGSVTGELVGVTIKGDLIEANTLKADKLVIKGEDGIYYKLNISGESIETEQTDQNSLNGTVIAAKTITASKISVDDLVAFGATIAGFVIDEMSIYSAGKGSITSDAKGLYMDKEGQFYIGDAADHIKYHKNQNGEYILDIKAKQIRLGIEGNQIIDGETVTQINRTEAALNHITSVFQITGGTNLIKNSVWYYQSEGRINDWDIAPGTTYEGGQDDSLIGETISRGRISITNGFAQTGRYNISDIILNRSIGVSFSYKQGDNTISKIELFAGSDTSDEPIWSKEIVENTNDIWKDVYFNFISNSSYYILKITSNSTSNNSFLVTDLMFNYGEKKGWELASGEVFGTIIKLNNLGIQVTGESANTETFMTTNGVVIFNKTTNAKVTNFTDKGVNTENLFVDKKIEQKQLIHDIININNVDVYIEYIIDREEVQDVSIII